MQSVELTFVRHGETQQNIEGVLQGHLNAPLNEKGLREAEEISQYIRKFDFDIIFSSDLLRALQCAEKIKQYFPNTKFIEEPLLRERYFGKHQGKKLTDLGYKDLTYLTMVKHLYECNCPGGETNKQVINRIKKFIDICFREYQGKKILVITHGGIVMLALNYIFNEEPSFRKRRIHDNGFVSYVQINEKLEISDSLISIHCKDLLIKNIIKSYGDELMCWFNELMEPLEVDVIKGVYR